MSKTMKSVIRNSFGRVLIIVAGLFLFPVLLHGAVDAQELIDSSDPKAKVKFLITALDDDEKEPRFSFRVGEKIIIEAVLRNDSDTIYPHTIINLYYHYQFNLHKVGKRSVEKFRADKIESISNGEREPTYFARMVASPIKPGETRLLDRLELGDWYENLEPGEYRLTIQYRAHPGRPVLLSNMLMIEIVP